MSDHRAEAQPLHDILRDAAGYLVKLGTNLQLRAERLRQRKVSSTTSVRKITDKVLLICDLSKKSIEKVEDVVRKGVSDDAPSVSRSERRISSVSSDRGGRSRRVEKAKLRKIGNTLVRIPRQIHLAHFESCHVKVRALPRTFLNKYPIYFHCRTWRARREKSAIKKDSSVENNVNLTDRKRNSSSETETHCEEKIEKHSELYSDKDNSKTDSNKPYSSLSRTKPKCKENQKSHEKNYCTKNPSISGEVNFIRTHSDSSEGENKSSSQRQVIPSSKENKDEDESVSFVAAKNKRRISSSDSSELETIKLDKTFTESKQSSNEKAKSPLPSKEPLDSSPREHADCGSQENSEILKSDSEQNKTKPEDCKQSESPKKKSKRKDLSSSDKEEHKSDNETSHRRNVNNNIGIENNSTTQNSDIQTVKSSLLISKELLESSPKESLLSSNNDSVSSHNETQENKQPETSEALTSKKLSDDPILSPEDKKINNTDSNNCNSTEKNYNNCSREKATPEKRDSVLTISSSDDERGNRQVTLQKGREEQNIGSESDKRLSSNMAQDFGSVSTLIEKGSKLEEGNISTVLEECAKVGVPSEASRECPCSDDDTQSQKSSDSSRLVIKCIDLKKLLKSPLKEPNSLLVETHSVHRPTEESKHYNKVNRKKNRVKNVANKPDLHVNERETAINQLVKISKHRHQRTGTPHSKPRSSSNQTSGISEISTEQAQKLRDLLVNFMPKKCTINVARIDVTSFNNKFLEKHGIQRITQGGSIVSSHVNSSAKTDLLNESSDSSRSIGKLSKKKFSGDGQTRRKHMLESIRAKRMLLTYSSSSDTDTDKQRDEARKLREIKESLLKGISSGEDDESANRKSDVPAGNKSVDGATNKSEDEKKDKSVEVTKSKYDEEVKKIAEENKRKLLDSSSSSISDQEVEIDTINCALSKLEKEMQVDETNGKNRSSSEEKQREEHKVAEIEKKVKASERASSKTSSISQVDGNDDESTGSDSEMGRTTRSRTTASAQSSDAADNDDKSIDGLMNLKSLHRKNMSESPSSTSDIGKSKKKAKGDNQNTKTLDEDILLDAESKSSSSQESEEMEDLPEESERNGEPIGELARADLLGEDSDSTHDTGTKDSDDASSKSNGKPKRDGKKRSRKGKPGKVIELDSTEPEDSEAEEDLKVRRRKPEVISSEDEAGSSKKKKAEKDSDYDNGSAASDDSADHFKKSKRKAKKSSDSDSTGKSSSDGRKKKRRRIKQVKDSEGSDQSGSDNDGKKGGRKNIRKMMGKDQLEEATKKAAREERERMARIAERQKQYNNTAFDESGKPDEIKLDKVVLDFDPETKEPLIQVDPGIVKKLKPHQANGIKFMWDACFESVKQIKKGRGSGCILAHCMGLGKTLQVVSLTHTLLNHEKLTGVRRVLVVCPLSTVLNWVSEFRMWIEHAESNNDIDIYELSRFKQNHERSYQLKEWMETGGVCVLGYEMFRNLSADNNKKFRKKMLATFQESLVNPGPDLVVCDEGHLLKNEKTSLSQSMNRVRTLRRIVLTGTPLQNNLKEYYCMVQFVKPNLLGKYNEYLNRFVNPITNGQYTNSTEQDIRVMKRRSHVLHKMLDGAVQRRDYGVLAPFLPPKHEYVLFITLTDVQIKLYQHYLDNYSRRQQGGRNSGFLFPDFQALQRIWTHPLVLKANSERYEIAQQKKRDREEEEDSEGSLADFLDDDSTPEESTTEEETDVSDGSNDSRKKSKKKSGKKSKNKSEASSSRRSTRANPDARAEEIDMKELKDPYEPRAENPTEWWIKLVEEKELEDVRNSNKLMLLFDILRQCEAIGDKLLVFSQSLYSLDLIEQFLSRIDDSTQMGKVEETLGNHVGSWSQGIDYFRLDGSTSCENRAIWCKNFNREDNPRARLFLISTRAGGLGINLVAANRVVIFDVSWNPSHDVQSIFRVYRFGQKKPCYVYRFLAMGTMEEKIYERQVTKQAISKRVIDEQQIDRHYNENDLQELYTFQPHPEQPRPVPLLPKDRLFAEMLKEHEKLIYRYHEHDSLLENKEEETLTEEERRAAWEDFENEKNRPPPAPFPNPGFAPMNGMSNMMQQQLALATMLSMLRKDYPGLSEQQVASFLPQLLYADPSMYGGYDFNLMQKMRALSGMGAGMMGAGGAGAGAGGGALGYAPTWQQQQQMQLQRLQQQQALGGSGPGVKYYAGGLGSRDPMSMALQQKQQREMMLNSTGDRLRDMLVGAAPHAHRQRPPPRPPATHTAEVVNLDDSE